MLEDLLKNYSKIEIEIRTKFSKQIQKEEGWDDEDITLEVEKSFHEAVRQWVDEQITENEDFEQEILEIMKDNGLTNETDEFCKLGQISISLSQTKNSFEKEINKIEQEENGK